MNVRDLWERIREWIHPPKPTTTPEQHAYRELMREKHYADRS